MVDEDFYPYSPTSKDNEKCSVKSEKPYFMGPVYPVKSNEKDIKLEILNYGSVQGKNYNF